MNIEEHSPLIFIAALQILTKCPISEIDVLDLSKAFLEELAELISAGCRTFHKTWQKTFDPGFPPWKPVFEWLTRSDTLYSI